MAAVVKAAITDKVATLTLDTVAGLVVGEHVHVYNVGPHFDGHHVLTTVNTGPKTVTYPAGGQDVAEFTTAGILVELVTWIDADDVEDFLGATMSGTDTDYLDLCVTAANAWAYRRRAAAGYKDNPTVAPGGAAKLGTVIYAGHLFREKGSVDSFASYQDMPPQNIGGLGQVLRLLGINRPVVA